MKAGGHRGWKPTEHLGKARGVGHLWRRPEHPLSVLKHLLGHVQRKARGPCPSGARKVNFGRLERGAPCCHVPRWLTKEKDASGVGTLMMWQR